MNKTRSILLYPFSIIYGLVTGIRNFLYNSEILSSQSFNIPVICIGNLTVGGTGKTPHTEYLAGLLGREFKVAVLSRGYRRKSKGFLLATRDSKVADIGDEPLQIYSKSNNIIVAVDNNRVNGVNSILESFPDTSVILLDDAYQHRRITPGFSILLSDYDRLFIHDHLLPYGNLREYPRNMDRADVILITKCPPGLSPIQRRIIVKEVNKSAYQNLYFTSVKYDDPLPVFGDQRPFPRLLSKADADRKGAVLVTGIANPEPLAEFLKDSFKELVHFRFNDHHEFTAGEIENIMSAWSKLKTPEKYIITTEKDAVRLREFTNIAEPGKSSFYYIPIGIFFLNDDKEEFDNLITDYVRKNKRNNRVS
jgi:tetraacyldisaccharide 4'-kinase